MSNIFDFQENYDAGFLGLNDSYQNNTFLQASAKEHDVYKFNLNQTLNIAISLNIEDTSDDAGLVLVRDTNQNGQLDDPDIVVETSGQSGDDSINYQDASADTYFVTVSYSDGGIDNILNYDLELSATESSTNFSPTELQFTIDSNSLNNRLLELKQAWIYDENGSSDLVSIDFWLQSPDGSWIDVADAQQFNAWSEGDRWASFDYQLNLDEYTAGEYTLWAQGYDRADNISNSVIKSFTISDTNNDNPTGFSFEVGRDSQTYTPTETVTLKNGWVYDFNGTDDLSKIDFWLSDGNEWFDIADVTSFTPWSEDDRWAGFDYQIDLDDAAPGEYTLWGQAYDQNGGVSNNYTTKITVVDNSAPEQLQLETVQSSYSPTDTISLSNAWVYDSNSADNLASVDLWLQKPNGSWEDLDDVTEFETWIGDENWASFEYEFNLGSSTPGTYQVWGQAYDHAGEESNEAIATFTITDNSGIF